MKRDKVTFALPHDEHVRDFRMFIADTAARRRLADRGRPRQRIYANRRLLAAESLQMFIALANWRVRRCRIGASEPVLKDAQKSPAI
jgi:hypothetical protein